MELKRRTLLQALVSAAVISASAGNALAAETAQTKPAPRRRTLIKGGYVATVDPRLGEIPGGDVLIDGGTIAQVGKNIHAPGAEVVDARNALVIPGFIDTHRHTWSTTLRGMIPDGDLPVYLDIIDEAIAQHYRPQDVYAANLLGGVSAINDGITTTLDWSHIANSYAHVEAAFHGDKDSGVRCMFAPGLPHVMFDLKTSDFMERLQKQYFSSALPLLTLALSGRSPAPSTFDGCVADMQIARKLGILVVMHYGTNMVPFQAITKLDERGLLGSAVMICHPEGMPDAELKMLADHGCTLSSSPMTEMMSQGGFPDVQKWLSFGLRPSLSSDNETRSPSDMFSQMRSLLLSDRSLEIARAATEKRRPHLLPIRDVLSFATLDGARAIGLADKVGSLTPGKRADVVLIDMTDIKLMPVNGDPVATALTQGRPSDVSWVFVDGQLKKRNGKLVNIDVARVRRVVAKSHEYIVRLVAEHARKS